MTTTVCVLASNAAKYSRDVIADIAIESYSTGSICSGDRPKQLSITVEECAARVENAKKLCSPEIRRDLPEKLTDKELQTLVARAAVCKTAIVYGMPYRNEDWADEIKQAMQ